MSASLERRLKALENRFGLSAKTGLERYCDQMDEENRKGILELLHYLRAHPEWKNERMSSEDFKRLVIDPVRAEYEGKTCVFIQGRG